MSRYTFIPTFNYDDPAQTTTDINSARKLAEEFLRKFGSDDCQSLTIVEVIPVATIEYARPIFTPLPRRTDQPGEA